MGISGPVKVGLGGLTSSHHTARKPPPPRTLVHHSRRTLRGPSPRGRAALQAPFRHLTHRWP